MATEADTCRKYVLPRLYEAGWLDEQIGEQRTFTDGRIYMVGNKAKRRPKKRADYLLRYKRDLMLAVVEAKALYKSAAEGLQQAKDYAQILGLPFAYATNGKEIIEHDLLTGIESKVDTFPGPRELWARYCAHHQLGAEAADKFLAPCNHNSGKVPRYYQEIAINRAIQAVLQGKKRILLNLATGTGKTVISFQICWKLWSARWNRTGEHRKPRILFLADRSVLVDDPKDKTFAAFGDARWKIEGEAVRSREIYFSTYQAIAADERRQGLYKEYPRDFFDLIVIDECHRGSARDDSSWREILEYYHPAFQLGLTATPLREDNRDTYAYFGNPLYTYSLRQGIADGFLAPYRVHRVIASVDAAGWRPDKGMVDRYGQEIPDELYVTRDFERIVSLRNRTIAVAKHLTEYLKKTDRMAKTIVFCVDQEHAEDMRSLLTQLNSDVVKLYPDYVCRVTSDEGDIGRGHLSRFQELESDVPVILTTSQMLTTGVDAPTCKNVVIFRVINSMSEFKQIIGRGTRVREDYGKLTFTIVDYTGSATQMFADPEFDGEPVGVREEEIDDSGDVIEGGDVDGGGPDDHDDQDGGPDWDDDDSAAGEETHRKFYVDGGAVEIITHLIYEMDSDGNQLRVIKYTDYTADKVRSLARSAAELRAKWAFPSERQGLIDALEERGISVEQLAEALKQPGADPFDLLCHVAFNAPLLTRRQRADILRRDGKNFFDQFGPEAREILEELLEKYAEFGTDQLTDINVLKVEPISRHGNIREIAEKFGGPEQLRQALDNLQLNLYSA